jgi:hypothetical protein
VTSVDTRPIVTRAHVPAAQGKAYSPNIVRVGRGSGDRARHITLEAQVAGIIGLDLAELTRREAALQVELRGLLTHRRPHLLMVAFVNPVA